MYISQKPLLSISFLLDRKQWFCGSVECSAGSVQQQNFEQLREEFKARWHIAAGLSAGGWDVGPVPERTKLASFYRPFTTDQLYLDT